MNKCDDIKPVEFLGLTKDFIELKNKKFILEGSVFIGIDTGFYSVYYNKKWNPDHIILF